MKNSLILCLTIAVAMLVCPAAALGGGRAAPQEDKPAAAAAELQPDDAKGYISVMASSDKSVSKVKMREYVLGCVAAEMPANYHPEALRAQAVASYTYAKGSSSGTKGTGAPPSKARISPTTPALIRAIWAKAPARSCGVRISTNTSASWARLRTRCSGYISPMTAKRR